MKVAVGFNPVLSISESVNVATGVESAGYDSLWMHESLFQRDVVTYISAMASRTSKLRFGSGVINTFTRHPVAAAATFASLSELSDGRVALGLGLGSFPTVPMIGQKIFPVSETRPLQRLKEYVEVVRRLWAGEKVDFEGEFFKVHGLSLGFEVKEKIPLFIASLSPKTQAYAGATADGVILSPAFNTVIGTGRMLENVKKGEERAGRSVERASYMMVSADPDPAAAFRSIRDYYFFVYQLADVVKPETLGSYGVTDEMLRPMKDAWKRGDIQGAKKAIPDAAIEALAVVGDADHALDRVGEYVKAGVTLPILMPIGNVGYAVEEMAPSKW
jgi:5,10-methylenetetrahydromethanopterin reductase